jgi:hypothetical protein
MDPLKSKHLADPPRSSTVWRRMADGLMCETCRRYRRGLAAVLAIAFALWLGGHWG